MQTGKSAYSSWACPEVRHSISKTGGLMVFRQQVMALMVCLYFSWNIPEPLAWQCAEYEGSPEFTPAQRLEEKIKDKFINADYVFSGKAKEINSEEYKTVVFEMIELYKGKSEKQIALHLPIRFNDRKMFNFLLNEEYLIYAVINDNGNLDLGGLCDSPTATLLNESNEELRVINLFHSKVIPQGKSAKLDYTIRDYNEKDELLLERNYSNELRDGVEKIFFEDGRIKRERVFNKGRYVGMKLFYPSGPLKWTENISSIPQDIIKQVFDERGNKTFEEIILDQTHTLRKEFYENNAVKSEGAYNSSGQLDGVEKVYWENGKLQNIGKYKNSESSEITYFDQNGDLRNGVEKVMIAGSTIAGLYEEIHYENGKKIRAQIFTKERVLRSETIWNEGQSVETKNYF